MTKETSVSQNTTVLTTGNGRNLARLPHADYVAERAAANTDGSIKIKQSLDTLVSVDIADIDLLLGFSNGEFVIVTNGALDAVDGKTHAALFTDRQTSLADLFNKVGTSFAAKPGSLRLVSERIDAAPPPEEELRGDWLRYEEDYSLVPPAPMQKVGPGSGPGKGKGSGNGDYTESPPVTSPPPPEPPVYQRGYFSQTLESIAQQMGTAEGMPNVAAALYTHAQFKIVPSGRSDLPSGAYDPKGTTDQLATRASPVSQAAIELIQGSAGNDTIIHNTAFADVGQWSKTLHVTINNFTDITGIKLIFNAASIAQIPGFDLKGVGVSKISGTANGWEVAPSANMQKEGFDVTIVYDAQNAAGKLPLDFLADLVVSGHYGKLAVDQALNMEFTWRDAAGRDEFTVASAKDGKPVMVLPRQGVGVEIFAEDGDDYIVAGVGPDLIHGGNGNDSLFGGMGNDTLDGGPGADSLDGESGIDTVTYENSTAGPVNVNLKTASGTFGDAQGDTYVSIENIIATKYNDTLTGDDNDNLLQGLAGDDRLFGGRGNNTLDGGEGNDTADYAGISASAGNIGVRASLVDKQSLWSNGSYRDTLTSIENLDGSDYKDTLIGDAGANLLRGGKEDDWLEGRGGGDTLDGGDGDHDTVSYAWLERTDTTGVNADLAVTGTKNATLLGAYGDDSLTGVENLVGSQYNDTLRGDAKDNRLEGGEGDDILEGRSGADTLVGGKGTDTASYEHAPDLGSGAGVKVSLTTGLITATNEAVGDTFDTIENLLGSAFNDQLIGDKERNILWGGEGNDTLEGMAGADTLEGDGGNNTASYEHADGAVAASLTASFSAGAPFHAQGHAEGDEFHNIQNLIGTQYKDTLIGDDQTNHLTGGDGDDTLEGMAGADTLDGGAGINTASYAHAPEDTTLSIPGLSGVRVSLEDPAQNTGHATGDTFIKIHNLNGSDFNDLLISDLGSAAGGGKTAVVYPPDVSGGPDKNKGNVLSGGKGNDTLVGGTADDPSSTTGTLADTLEGGAGNDRFELVFRNTYSRLSAISIDGGDGDETTGDTLVIDTSKFLTAWPGWVRGVSWNVDMGNNQGTPDSRQENGTLRNNWSIEQARFSNIENLEIYSGSGGTARLVAILNNDDNRVKGGENLTDFVSYQYAYSLGSTTAETFNRSAIRADLSKSAGLNTNTECNVTGGGGNDTLIDIEGIQASSYNDWLSNTGSMVNVTIHGGSSGHDYIRGGSGNDSLTTGNYGNSTLFGGDGNDTLSGYYAYRTSLDGGAGNDNIRGSAWAYETTLRGGSGNDTIYAGEGNDWIDGGDDADTIYGGSGNDTIYGGSGDDSISGGPGNDWIDGGNGADTIVYGPIAGISAPGATAGVTVRLAAGIDAHGLAYGLSEGGAGNDTLYGFQHIVGSSFADLLVGDDQNNSIVGGDGNDTIEGGKGNDTLRGEGGLNTVSYAGTDGSVTVNLTTNSASGADGTDELYEFQNIVGSAYADILAGDARANSIEGGDGNDLIEGRGGNDTLSGGAGNDTVSYTYITGGNAVSANLSTSTLNSIPGNTANIGTETNALKDIESLIGSKNNDELHGSSGNNTLDGYLGNDKLYGEGGDDTLSLQSLDTHTNVTVTVTLGSNTAQKTVDGNSYTDTVIGFNRVIGSKGNDIITGAANKSETLEGGAGDDTLDGGAFSGTGDANTVSYEHAGNAVAVDIATNTASGGAGNDALTNFSHIIGSSFGDVLTGNDNANRIEGGAGNDELSGAGGDDTLSGGAGNNSLDGGTGQDTASYAASEAGVIVNISGGTATISGVALETGRAQHGASRQYTDTLVNIEALQGTRHDDHFLLGQGGNNVNGGEGKDTADYRNASGAVTASLTTGDVSISGISHDTLTGIENLTGSSFGDSLTGDAGNNFFIGYGGSDTITGGTGNDTVSYAWYSNEITVNLAAMNNLHVTLSGGVHNTLSGIENIIGGSGNDKITGDGQDNIFEGGAGDDSLDGGTGTNTVSYEHAISAVSVNIATGVASGGDGNDRLSNFTNIIGSAFNDSLTGNVNANTIQGGAGNDSLYGGAGNDVLYGGADNDILYGEIGNDSLYGGTGNDSLYGGAGNDSLDGGAGNDLLYGGAGNDLLTGGDGIDTASYADITSGTGTSNLWGVYVNISGAQSTTDTVLNTIATQSGWGAALASGLSTGAGDNDTLSGIENLTGTNFRDYLVGSDSDNHLIGGAGNDTIWGGAGNDTIDATLGNDFVRGESGDDLILVDVNNLPQQVAGDYVGAAPAGQTNGFDTLKLSGLGTAYDLGTLVTNRVYNMECLDIRGDGQNTALTLNSSNIASFCYGNSTGNIIWIKADAGDTLNITTAAAPLTSLTPIGISGNQGGISDALTANPIVLSQTQSQTAFSFIEPDGNTAYYIYNDNNSLTAVIHWQTT